MGVQVQHVTVARMACRLEADKSYTSPYATPLAWGLGLYPNMCIGAKMGLR